MQLTGNLIQVNITEVEALTTPKPRLCFLFDGFDTSEAKDFKITQQMSWEAASKDTELTELQKSVLERAFQQGGLSLVEIDKLDVVMVKDVISNENLQKALDKYWAIVDCTITDFTTKFADLNEEKRVFSLVKDLSAAKAMDTEYPDTPEARFIEVWWNGDPYAHVAMATCYMYRHPEVGAARQIYMEPTDDDRLSGSEKLDVTNKAINDVIVYPLKQTNGEDKEIFFFSMPLLKDGSDLVKDYNRAVTVSALKLAMIKVFMDNEVPYEDASIGLLTEALDNVFENLMLAGNVAGRSGTPLASYSIPQIKTLSDELRKARKFSVNGSYFVPGGTKAIVLNYEIHQQ